MDPLLSGSELVLVAQVPKSRWGQVQFNLEVGPRFFRVAPGRTLTVSLERVSANGTIGTEVSRRLVFSSSNRNYKLEFDFGEVEGYPEDGPPLLLVLELDVRRFRYFTLVPGDPGYAPVMALNQALPRVGRGHRRVVTTLDEVELRWPACPLRAP